MSPSGRAAQPGGQRPGNGDNKANAGSRASPDNRGEADSPMPGEKGQGGGQGTGDARAAINRSAATGSVRQPSRHSDGHRPEESRTAGWIPVRRAGTIEMVPQERSPLIERISGSGRTGSATSRRWSTTLRCGLRRPHPRTGPRTMRAEFKRHSRSRTGTSSGSEIAEPLIELENRVAQELLPAAPGKKALVPLDRDPVAPEVRARRPAGTTSGSAERVGG